MPNEISKTATKWAVELVMKTLAEGEPITLTLLEEHIQSAIDEALQQAKEASDAK